MKASSLIEGKLKSGELSYAYYAKSKRVYMASNPGREFDEEEFSLYLLRKLDKVNLVPFTEIADRLGITVGEAQYYHDRAIKKLKKSSKLVEILEDLL